jgi:hypothetical protein
VYRDTRPTSYSYYGFPSKTLSCLASNVPIVITNVAHFNEQIEARGIGRVVEPDARQIEQAILQLRQQYESFSESINRFRTHWNEQVELFHYCRLRELWAETPVDGEKRQAEGECSSLFATPTDRQICASNRGDREVYEPEDDYEQICR